MFLSSLITLRVKPDPETLIPTQELEDEAREWIREMTGVSVNTVPEVIELLETDDEPGYKLAR